MYISNEQSHYFKISQPYFNIAIFGTVQLQLHKLTPYHSHIHTHGYTETAATLYIQWLYVASLACPHMYTHDTSHVAMI